MERNKSILSLILELFGVVFLSVLKIILAVTCVFLVAGIIVLFFKVIVFFGG